MIESVTGGRKQVFTFEPGLTQPKTVTTPSGEVIEYDYQPQLGNEPLRRRLPRLGVQGEFEEANYEYDGQNARLLFCEEQGLQLSRTYFSTGELKSEKRLVEEGEFTMHYRYSRQSRLLGYTDVLGQQQSYEYDPQGRLIKTELGTTASTFTYDVLGRTATIDTHDSQGGQSVGITLQYDEFDREVLRSFDLDGVKQTLSQVYNDVDGLKQRTLKEGATVLRDEAYEYDLRGRLTNYKCTGSQPPVDPYGKAISEQVFGFDALDNLTVVVTYWGELFNRARYLFENPDKTQLSKVTNTHEDYPPQIDLLYNPDGHMIRDEEQRTLTYDSLGRLILVEGLEGGKSSSLGYDPLDNMTSENDGDGNSQRFYQGDQLANQLKGANSSTFMRADRKVLVELKVGADPKSLLLGVDHKNSVLSEIDRSGRKDIAYTPYGHRADEVSVSAQLGFNGERREAQTGCYLLGNGYRAFSPVLMRFNSPDSWSPFEVGGMNAYTYCEGDSINNVDPSGHVVSPWQAFQAFIKSNPKGNTNNKRYAAKVESAEYHRGQNTPAAKDANARLAAANAKLQSKASKNQSGPGIPKPDYDSDSSSSLAGAGHGGRASVRSTAGNPGSDFSNSPFHSGQTVSGGKPTVTPSKPAPTVATRRAAPKINPNAEEIARLQVDLKAAKNVRHAYMLDQKRIDKLTAEIERLRLG